MALLGVAVLLAGMVGMDRGSPSDVAYASDPEDGRAEAEAEARAAFEAASAAGSSRGVGSPSRAAGGLTTRAIDLPETRSFCRNESYNFNDCVTAHIVMDALYGDCTECPDVWWVIYDPETLRVVYLSKTNNEFSLDYGGLGNMGLSGVIPPEIGDLTALEKFDVSSSSLDEGPENQLTGSIPSQLGNLNNLTWLSLSSNQLTGSIPSQLGNLNNLTWLSLSSNQLTGSIPSQLGNLTKLTSLWLFSNELTGNIPSELGSLTELENLALALNLLTGNIPSELGNLTKLTYLSLDHNQLTGCVPATLQEAYSGDDYPICSANLQPTPTPTPGASTPTPTPPAKLTAPPIPEGLTVASVEENAVNLQWDHREGIQDYYVSQSLTRARGSWSEVGRPRGDVTTLEVSGLTCETLHYFAIKARGDGQRYLRAYGGYAYTKATTAECSGDETTTPTPTPTPLPTATPTPAPTETLIELMRKFNCKQEDLDAAYGTGWEREGESGPFIWEHNGRGFAYSYGSAWRKAGAGAIVVCESYVYDTVDAAEIDFGHRLLSDYYVNTHYDVLSSRKLHPGAYRDMLGDIGEEVAAIEVERGQRRHVQEEGEWLDLRTSAHTAVAFGRVDINMMVIEAVIDIEDQYALPLFPGLDRPAELAREVDNRIKDVLGVTGSAAASLDGLSGVGAMPATRGTGNVLDDLLGDSEILR